VPSASWVSSVLELGSETSWLLDLKKVVRLPFFGGVFGGIRPF